MALANMFAMGMRANGIRITGSRSVARLPNVCPRRQLSALVQHSALRSVPKSHVPMYARNMSLSSPPPPSVTPISPPEEPSDVSEFSPDTDALATLPPNALTASDVSDSTEAIIPPLELGDLADMGLITWTPAGLVRKMIELLVVSAGIPWFWSIVITTAFLRVISLPLVVRSVKASMALAPFKAEMEAAQALAAEASRTKDPVLMSQAAVMQHAVKTKTGFRFSHLVGAPLLQATTGFGLFLGVEKMCTHPVLQMRNSGLDILPDLLSTVPSPALALVSAALINLQITVSRHDTDPKQGHMTNAMRALSLVSIPIMSFMPVGVHIPILTGILVSVLQTYTLQRPAVRSFLGLPPAVVYEGRHPTIAESVAYARQRLKEKNELERSRAEEADRRGPR